MEDFRRILAVSHKVRFYRTAACPPSFKASLNMLRLHRILRPNESFHAFLLFSLIQLIPHSKRTNPYFWLTFICWQVICYYFVDVIKKIKKWRNNHVKNQYGNA
jgi:hypothetical protein